MSDTKQTLSTGDYNC